jgi:hypothetical protein
MPNIADKAWLTGRTRMVTEARLIRQGRLWNLLIIWYSVGLTCLTVFQLYNEPDESISLVAAILAVSVLSLSIYIPTLGFERQAELFRRCYLRLQRLVDETTDNAELTKQYHEILAEFPNHPTRDWSAFLIASQLAGNPPTNDGNEIPIPWPLWLKHYSKVIFETILWIAAFAAPGIVFCLIIQ